MKYSFTILFLIINLAVYAFGIGDWQNETPGGNYMGDPGNGTLLTIRKTHEELLGIKKWYFYKGFIVGTLNKQQFILEESSGEKLIFKDQNIWKKEIQSRGLEPILWTRWYKDNWVDGDWLIIWMFFGFFVSIPLAIFFLFAIYRMVIKERFRLRSFYTIFVLTILISLGVTLILDYYPNSM